MWKPPVIICDLDGTLCDLTHRLHYVKGKHKNWNAFHVACKDDGVIMPVYSLLNYLSQDDMHKPELIFCSGRWESARPQTVEWLKTHCPSIQYEALFMRPDKDNRPDFIIKEEILDRDILPRWNPLFVLDDRSQVIEMWKRRGIFTFDVNQLPHEKKIF